MILDNNGIFSDGQAITATVDSTNVLDMGAPGVPFNSPAAVEQDVGKGTMIPFAFIIQQGFNNLTSLTVSLQKSADNVTYTEVATRTFLLAEINQIGLMDFPAYMPPGANRRYLKMTYTVNGTAPTTGKVFAGVVAARQSNLH